MAQPSGKGPPSVAEGRPLHDVRPSGSWAIELGEAQREVSELRQAVGARDDFITIAGHELRNPMTPILGMAELALAAARNAGESCPPRVIVLLERLQGLVVEYVGRAERLLDVSRIAAGNLRLEPASLDLSALVLSVAERYAVVASRGCSRVDFDIQVGIVAVLDRLAVQQVVDNLLSNALKFGIGKPVTVRLQSDGRSARLDVQDRGPGMPEDQLARIFGRFEQLVAQHRGGGFGVGLWIADRLVAAMAGSIAVSSRLGEGSVFTISLPLGTSESSEDKA